jgi:hypothetical protein
MNKFDDTNSSFKSALESTGTFSPKLIEEAMKIHTSSDLKATESNIASDYPNNRVDAALLHLALLGAAKSDVAKADPQLQASIYRDLAVQQQGLAVSSMAGSDWLRARSMLNLRVNDSDTAQDYINRVEGLDSKNKDLKQLHTIQDQLSTQLRSVALDRGTLSQLDTDALAFGIAVNLDINWNSAKHGSVRAAAQLQQFVDRASLSRDDEILPKIYNIMDPHIAKQLKKAVENHEVIDFD